VTTGDDRGDEGRQAAAEAGPGLSKGPLRACSPPRPCSPAALRGPAALQPCSPAALQPWSPAALQPCSPAALQPCSPAALQPCRPGPRPPAPAPSPRGVRDDHLAPVNAPVRQPHARRAAARLGAPAAAHATPAAARAGALLLREDLLHIGFVDHAPAALLDACGRGKRCGRLGLVVEAAVAWEAAAGAWAGAISSRVCKGGCPGGFPALIPGALTRRHLLADEAHAALGVVDAAKVPFLGKRGWISARGLGGRLASRAAASCPQAPRVPQGPEARPAHAPPPPPPPTRPRPTCRRTPCPR
jgi:hypothetical protein